MTQKNKYLYKNILIQGSFQSVGHGEEYFIQRTQHLIIIYSMPRMQRHTNDIYIYEKRKLTKIIHKRSSSHPLLHYLCWQLAYWYVLMNICKKDEKWIIFTGHPIFFFFMPLQKLIRQVRFAYWVGDYFPGLDWRIRMYERLKKHYHDAIPITYYLSDRINSRMNGGVVKNTFSKKTIAWGMKPLRVGNNDQRTHRLAFVGVIKPSQNIEAILEYLYRNPSWSLKLIGVSEENYSRKLRQIITKYSLGHRVWYPDKFIPDSHLKKELNTCSIGLALYKSGKNHFTWYTDPGKIKTYLEFGLPVIMTDTSSITKDIISFHCGEIVKEKSLDYYISKVITNYASYQQGIQKIIRHYEFITYYDDRFVALRG